jgi:hypothetical protein
MNITKNIITDLLPIYYSEECSDDTKLLVEEYLQKNPEFKQEAKHFSQIPLPKNIPRSLNKEDEMKSLVKTRRLLKWRSYLMGFAIFFSCATFSFVYDQGNFHWIVLSSLNATLFYGTLGIGFWVAYFIARRRTSDL